MTKLVLPFLTPRLVKLAMVLKNAMSPRPDTAVFVTCGLGCSSPSQMAGVGYHNETMTFGLPDQLHVVPIDWPAPISAPVASASCACVSILQGSGLVCGAASAGGR